MSRGPTPSANSQYRIGGGRANSVINPNFTGGFVSSGRGAITYKSAGDMAGGGQSQADKLLALAGQSTPAKAASTNPHTRPTEAIVTPDPITNSGPVTGGIVDSENQAGGRRRRARASAFASQELLG